MSVMGISCNVDGGRLIVRGVILDNGAAQEVFLHRSAKGEDLSLQLRSLSADLTTRLADLEVSCVVVRSADHHSAARLTEPSALRLRGEGVVLATARAAADRVSSLSGKAIGETCGSSKAAVDTEATALLNAAAREATAAALAAEHLLRSGRNGHDIGGGSTRIEVD